MKKFKPIKTIYLPHISYTVSVCDMTQLQLIGMEIKGGGYTMKIDESNCYIFFPNAKKLIKEPHNFPLVAHEVMHAIQYICEARGMEITSEMEHTAYLTHYILNEIFGYKYEVK